LKRDWKQRLWNGRAAIFIVLAAGFLLPWRPELLSWYNLETLLSATALLAVLAIGQSIVMISGGIDLSLPAVISACSVAGTALVAPGGPLTDEAWGVPAAVIIMLILGAAIGAGQGLAVAYLRMPPLLVSLTTLMFVSGTALWATQSNRYATSPEFNQLWYGRFAGVPLALPAIGIMILVAHLTMSQTLFGRRLYAIGQNAGAARIAGLPVARTVAISYALSGLCAAVASVFYSARLHTGSPELVQNSVLLDCIAAAVIGGVSLFGGRGTIFGAVMGAGFVALVGNGLNLIGLRYWHELIVKGGVIVLAVSIDAWGRRHEMMIARR
jgi:ribose transport system permease protein